MIKSMTGFGRCEISDEKRKFTVELKSVNHRYLDVNIKMPKKLNFFESAIRSTLKQSVQRGKIDLFITYEDFTESNVSIKYNHDIANTYFQYLEKMAEDFNLENDIRVSSLSRYPEVFSMEEQNVDEEQLWKGLERTILKAAEGFVESRIKEGEHLKLDMLEKLDGMLALLKQVEERSPQIIAEYRKIHSKKEAWPEIRKGIRSVGILEMEIYISGFQVFMIIETPLDFDWETAMNTLSHLPKQAEWEEYVSEFQECAPKSTSAEKWKLMERMFYLYD